jgi:hypothetical protein
MVIREWTWPTWTHWSVKYNYQWSLAHLWSLAQSLIHMHAHKCTSYKVQGSCILGTCRLRNVVLVYLLGACMGKRMGRVEGLGKRPAKKAAMQATPGKFWTFKVSLKLLYSESERCDTEPLDTSLTSATDHYSIFRPDPPLLYCLIFLGPPIFPRWKIIIIYNIIMGVLI